MIGFLSRAVLEGCERLPSPKTGGEEKSKVKAREQLSKVKMGEVKSKTGEQMSKPISLRIPLKYWHALTTQKPFTKRKWNCVEAVYQENKEVAQYHI